MDNEDIKDLIFDLLVIRGKLVEAKKTSQKHIQGWDWDDDLGRKVDYLEGLLSDVSDELDEIFTNIDTLSEGLEGRLYNNVMKELSDRLMKKWA
jgi:hypothetical protein